MNYKRVIGLLFLTILVVGNLGMASAVKIEKSTAGQCYDPLHKIKYSVIWKQIIDTSKGTVTNITRYTTYKNGKKIVKVIKSVRRYNGIK